MIDCIELTNYGIQKYIQWENLGNINLVIGGNGSGKTILLKAIYSALKTLEQNKRGNIIKPIEDILSDKMYWTFQPDKLGDLVNKREKILSFSLTEEDKEFAYSFGNETVHQIRNVHTTYDESREEHTIFLPAKEVVSLFSVIQKSRDQDAVFGFDDTYLDLVRALQVSPSKGRNNKRYTSIKKKFEDLIDGHIEYDRKSNQWFFKSGNVKYPIGLTSEGTKKIALFDVLLANRYLTPNSVVLIDEPESALHPTVIAKYLDMVYELSESGIQFFIATHSYFVIKKLCILAQKHKFSVPLLSLEKEVLPVYANLIDGMPENSIVEESVRLYEEEINVALGEL